MAHKLWVNIYKVPFDKKADTINNRPISDYFPGTALFLSKEDADFYWEYNKELNCQGQLIACIAIEI